MKKVLIITYYWPPAGGPGVQRWVKFVKYLRDFGIEPIVYVPENPQYPLMDSEMGKDLPQNIVRWSLPIWEPHTVLKRFFKKKTQTISAGIITQQKSLLEKILLGIRGNFFIPDARKFWVKPSVKFLSQRLSEEEISTVITSGPPHSLHLIGLNLKRQFTDLKWIADFRDPWVNISYHREMYLTPWALKKHEQQEKMVLQQADALIVTSCSTQKEFQSKTQRPVYLITNGYDSVSIDKQEVSSSFLISHIGSLLTQRNPVVLWEIFAEMLAEIPSFSNDFQLCLAGKVSDEVYQQIREKGLDKYLIDLGYITHKEAIKLQMRSQLLLLLEIDHPQNKGIIPGKLFEYMISSRPIVAIGPKDWNVASIITSTNTGKVFDYQQKKQLKDFLIYAYQLYQNGTLQTYPVGLAPYSRKKLTQKLSEIIFKHL